MSSNLSSRRLAANTSSDEVCTRILRLAEESNLGPGDQLPSVRDLAEQLGVKPTLVRDALLQARARGAVRIVPRTGAFLQTTSPTARALIGPLDEAATAALQAVLGRNTQNLLHLLDARRLIEVELIGRAAAKRQIEDLLPTRRALETLLRLPTDAPRQVYVEHDIRFHVELARLAGNDVLAVVQQTLMELLRPSLLDVPPTVERRMISDRSHAGIYAALADGDVERARDEMRKHLSLAYDSLLRDLQQPPPVLSSTAL